MPIVREMYGMYEVFFFKFIFDTQKIDPIVQNKF